MTTSISAQRLHVTVHPDVGWVFRNLISAPNHSFFFCPHTEDGRELLPMLAFGMGSAEVGTQGKWTIITPRINLAANAPQLDSNMARIYEGVMHHFVTEEKFHYAFCIPPYHYEKTEDDSGNSKVVALPVRENDILTAYHCSKNTRSEDRIGDAHLMAFESMYKAVLPAGLFGMVVPRGWLGRRNRYISWLQSIMACVAKIKLPSDAVQYIGENGPEHLPIEHELVIFAKTITGAAESRISNLFPFARISYPPFVHKLTDLNELSTYQMTGAFEQTEWHQLYVKLLRKTYEQNAGFYRMRLAASLPPVTLDDPRNTVMLVPGENAKKKLQVVDSLEDMRRLVNAVHIKVGSKVKLYTYNPIAEGLLLELRISMGRDTTPNAEYKWRLDEALSIMMFHEQRDNLAGMLINAGLQPCLLKSDHTRLAKQEKWAERQLCPIERTVKSGSEWITQFEEFGLRAQYPELVEQWRQRAKKMKMHKALFAFQFEDVLAHCCKDSMLNANVMGLGKTREILFAFLLRGNKKCLIVVPSKLLGGWIKEIERAVASYCTMARTHWNGEPMRPKASYQVIKWAEDCLPHNLKTINLISYQRLVQAPKDAVYFFCANCGSTSCSMKFAEHMPCPACNESNNKKWRKECKSKGLNKYWIHKKHTENISEEEEKQYRFHVRVRFGSKLEADLKANGYICIDPRPPKPDIVWMRPSKHILQKKKKVFVGQKEVHKPVNGKLIKTYEPEYKLKKKKVHLKWTFGALLRNRFNFIGVDEADYTKNRKAQRSMAVGKLRARSRITATGTPFDGLPSTILNLLNWTIKRVVFPLYRPSDKKAMRRFQDKYKTEVTITDPATGKRRKKVLPKILNPEAFQTEMSPFIVRHTRNEPAVTADIPEKTVKLHDIGPIAMDDEHRDYYELWLRKFKEWWQKMKDEEEGKKVPPGDILVKFAYLINASTIPHYMLDKIMRGKDLEAKAWAMEIGPYKGKTLPRKHLKCWELVKEYTRMGDKGIVFSTRLANLRQGMVWARRQKNPPVQALMIDGFVSRDINPKTNMSPRDEILDAYCRQEYSTLFAGLQCMRDGANLPEANHGIFLDLSWKPSDYRQASGRMIRPQQTKQVNLVHLIHEGTLDHYMSLLNVLKARSADEGLDFLDFGDFSSDMIPDARQYANSIVDGTEDVARGIMVLAVDHIRKLKERGQSDANI